MTHATIRQDAIELLFGEMRKSFDNHGPLRVAVDALIPDRLGATGATSVAGSDFSSGGGELRQRGRQA